MDGDEDSLNPLFIAKTLKTLQLKAAEAFAHNRLD